MGKTYVIGKIGKSVKFNPATWGSTGGDNEAPTLFKKIAQINKDDTFIVISRNDIDRNRKEQNIPDNLISIYENAPKRSNSDINFIKDTLHDKQIDGCFLVAGPVGNANISNKSYTRGSLNTEERVFAKTLVCFSNYVAPIYEFLNESNIPWVMIANDPRYISQGRDLLNEPKLILSQYEEVAKFKRFDNFESQNLITVHVNAIYAGVERIFLIDKMIELKEKIVKFMIVLNEGAPSRYNMLKEYVLDSIQDVEIYGKWDDDIVASDKRFKGPLPFEKLQEKLQHIKYTFIIPIKKGWVTAKWAEMISFGIIPFFHPTYDENKYINVPDYIRIKSPKELGEKIHELESNPELYNKILNECLACIDENDFNGTKLSNTILSYVPAVNKPGQAFERSFNASIDNDLEW